jgi:hypothetical protein
VRLRVSDRVALKKKRKEKLTADLQLRLQVAQLVYHVANLFVVVFQALSLQLLSQLHAAGALQPGTRLLQESVQNQHTQGPSTTYQSERVDLLNRHPTQTILDAGQQLRFVVPHAAPALADQLGVVAALALVLATMKPDLLLASRHQRYSDSRGASAPHSPHAMHIVLGFVWQSEVDDEGQLSLK